MKQFDAVVVGAGPNGLAAAVELARNGLKVQLIEAADEIGGGTRTEELTIPGFLHDVCSAIHPTGVASPFFNSIDLDVEWIHPPIPFTHPLDDGRAVAMHRSVDDTAEGLGADRKRYISMMRPLVDHIDDVIDDFLTPMTMWPEHFFSFARMSALGILPANTLIQRFETDGARALLSGLSAHSIASFKAPGSAGVGLMLGAIGHGYGWPMAAGGSQAIAGALAMRLEELGGTIEVGRRVTDIEQVDSPIVVFDVMPDALSRIAGRRLNPSGRRRLLKWKAGAGVFKVDWALDGPIPWADPLSSGAGTVHVGGEFEEVRLSESEVAAGRHPERPFVLVAQQSLFDPTRAPGGSQTAWGYCHVPAGSRMDMTSTIEDQIERFAPGFRDRIIGRHTMSPGAYEDYNPNYVGGDIGGGKFGLKKVLQLGRIRPFSFGNGIFLCSSATPPGAGVHGMCGYYAARATLSSIGLSSDS
ncbi:MAG TPA: NAD(P)/FAD-dependent oxidoreductase [Acidimicrobiia bacterium]